MPVRCSIIIANVYGNMVYTRQAERQGTRPIDVNTSQCTCTAIPEGLVCIT